MFRIQRNLASPSDLERRGKEGERQNKERKQAELWNGLHSFGTKLREAKNIVGVGPSTVEYS